MIRLFAGILLLAISIVGMSKDGLAEHDTSHLLRHCGGDRNYIEMWQPQVYQPLDKWTYKCSGYITGILDMHEFMVVEEGVKPYFCAPNKGTVSSGQAILIFIEWAIEHPEMLDRRARISVLLSLKDAFPC